jgi:hypothetical protein
MRQKAVISGLVLIAVGVVLGATVFRTDIAQATGLAQSVTVTNTPAQAVPVREQNLDGGNIKVHEQGTANVNVTNSGLSVTPRVATKTGGIASISAGAGSDSDVGFQFGTVNASLVTVTSQVGTGVLTFQNTNSTNGTFAVLQFPLEAGAQLIVPLVEAVPINNVHLHCSTACSAWFNTVGS